MSKLWTMFCIPNGNQMMVFPRTIVRHHNISTTIIKTHLNQWNEWQHPQHELVCHTFYMRQSCFVLKDIFLKKHMNLPHPPTQAHTPPHFSHTGCFRVWGQTAILWKSINVIIFLLLLGLRALQPKMGERGTTLHKEGSQKIETKKTKVKYILTYGDNLDLLACIYMTGHLSLYWD